MIRRSERGFSLIEVLIVVGLVLVLSSIAAPRLAEFWQHYQMEARARNIANMVLTARREAARSNRRTSIIWSGNPVDWYYIGIDTNGNNLIDPGEPKVTTPRSGLVCTFCGTFAFPHADYTLVPSRPGFGQGYVFGPDGTLQVASAGGGFQMDTAIRNILLYDRHGKKNYQYVISITPSGTTRIWYRHQSRVTGQWTPWQAL